MANPKQVQQLLFSQIKTALPGNISFADEMAELLQVSPDSAYRRIRGETLLTLDEMMLLCGKYSISLDSLLHINGNSLVFTGQQIDFDQFELEAHLAYILQQLQMLASHPNCRMYYLAKDVPVFHYFQFGELAAFKFYAWLKTLIRNNTHSSKKFTLDGTVNDKWQQLSQQIVATYASIPAEEIWSAEPLTVPSAKLNIAGKPCCLIVRILFNCYTDNCCKCSTILKRRQQLGINFYRDKPLQQMEPFNCITMVPCWAIIPY